MKATSEVLIDVDVQAKTEEAFFGNYKQYYKKRGLDSESRISCFKPDWINDKRCLDVGCSSGRLTLEIAKRYRPKYLLGIDKDVRLISQANNTLNDSIKEILKEKSNKMMPRIVTMNNTASGQGQVQPYQNISFSCQDILSMEASSKFESIFCLSVLKWIHLSTGDEGLMNFFFKVKELLSPGGYFILEYQPWKSYMNARKKTPSVNDVYKSIKIFPNEFQRILTSEVGLELVETLGTSLDEAREYNRPILVLRIPTSQKSPSQPITAQSKPPVAKKLIAIGASLSQKRVVTDEVKSESLEKPRKRLKSTSGDQDK